MGEEVVQQWDTLLAHFNKLIEQVDKHKEKTDNKTTFKLDLTDTLIIHRTSECTFFLNSPRTLSGF